MKTIKFIWKVFNTLLLVAILIIACILLKRVNDCCDCKESKYQQEKALILRTAEVYDSLTQNKGTQVWIDTLAVGQQGNSSITIWNDCPEKEIKKAPVISKKSVSSPKATKVVKESIPLTKEEPVQKDTLCQAELDSLKNLLISMSFAEKERVRSVIPDTLRIKLEKITSQTTSLLYSQTSVLPTQFDGIRNTTQFNYDFVPNLQLQEHLKKAKKHLWIGTTLASAGAVTYAGTWFTEIPTFVEYNGLDYFDPMNKYYEHNMLQKDRLNTLRWVRGVSVGVGVLGGLEIIHGIILLKNANLSIAPQRITLKYSF